MLGRGGLYTREMGKVCSRTDLLVCPQGNMLRDKGGRVVSTSGGTEVTHHSLSASLCLQGHMHGLDLDLVHPMHTLVFGE